MLCSNLSAIVFCPHELILRCYKSNLRLGFQVCPFFFHADMTIANSLQLLVRLTQLFSELCHLAFILNNLVSVLILDALCIALSVCPEPCQSILLSGNIVLGLL